MRLAATGLVLVVATVTVAPTAQAAATGSRQGADSCHGQPATIVDGSGGGRIIGTPGDDVIAANGGFDRVRARGGDDLVCGDKGGDMLFGGGDDDVLDGGRDGIFPDADEFTGDTIVGGPGNDRLDGGGDGRGVDKISYVGSVRGVRADLRARTVVGQGRDRLRAFDQLATSNHADTVLGSARSESVGLGGGRDVARMRAGDDAIGDRAGEIDLDTGPGSDDVTTDRGVIRTGSGRDEVWVLEGPARVRLGSGADFTETLRTRGPLTVRGGSGADNLRGGVGPDRLFGGGGGDFIGGNGGNDNLFGNEGDDVLNGARGGGDVGRGGPQVLVDECRNLETQSGCEA